VRGLLAVEDDFEVIGEAKDGKEAIELVAACRPDRPVRHQHADGKWRASREADQTFLDTYGHSRTLRKAR
jgi:hypothetical protein